MESGSSDIVRPPSEVIVGLTLLKQTHSLHIGARLLDVAGRMALQRNSLTPLYPLLA
jgi:hypothetical protein